MDNLRLPTFRDLSTTKKKEKTFPPRKNGYARDPNPLSPRPSRYLSAQSGESHTYRPREALIFAPPYALV